MVSGVSSLGGNSSSISTVSAETLKKLKELGLTSTGNEIIDKANIKKAEASKAEENSGAQNQAAQQQGSKPSSPYASIMSELGISETGDLDSDKEAIEAAISKLTSDAKTEAEKTNVENIQAQWTALQAQVQAKANSIPFETAQTQTAAINKQMLVNN